jgi:hypothetical protein
MKLKNFEQVLHAAPFLPFDIHIDGKSIRVDHPDQVLFAQDRATVVVAPSDNRFHIIEVERIEFLTTQPRRKAAK